MADAARDVVHHAEDATAGDRRRESEEQFRLAFEGAPIGMALVTLDGRFVHVNRALCEVLGYGAEELTGLTLRAITHPDDLGTDRELVRRLRRGEIARCQLAKRYVRKDGAVVDIILSGSMLRGSSGAPLYYLAQVEDVTERKRVEDALRASEAKFSGMVSIAADAIVAVGADQRVTIYNEGAQQIFGWAPAEVIGRPLDVLIPEGFRAAHRRHISRFAAEPTKARKMGERRRVLGRRKNGEEFPAEAAISKLTLADAPLFTVVLRDVTERVRAEREQRFLAEFSAALGDSLDFRATLARIARVAARELTDCCVVDLVEASGAARRLTVAHADPAKAAACRVLERLPPDRPGPVQHVLTTAQPLLLAEVTEAVLRSAVRDPRHLEALRELDPTSSAIVPMVARGHLLGAIAFVSTGTSRRLDDRDLRLAAEVARRAALALDNARLYEAAGRALRARDEVLGVVAHDLRNPLGIVLLQAQALRRRGGEPERRSQKPVEAIERAARRMNHLIQDLLDVARLDAGGLSIERARVATTQLLSDAAEAHRPLAASAAVELRLDAARDLPEVWADRDRLLQVLENLVGNAVKFTRRGGRITVGADHRGADVVFWVADTGPGIDADDVPHLFDRFWQARKTGRQGAGLGLPIAKGLVEAHGGRIWVESAPGRGTTFYFAIPAAPRPPCTDPRRA